MHDPRYERAKALFLAVCDLDEQARQEYLDRECRGDPVLRGEVESLIRAEPPSGLRPGGALEVMGIDLSCEESAVGYAPGARIGTYRLVKRIGVGAFGEVWIADQPNPVEPRVAIKVIKAGMDTREVLERFQQERTLLAQMRSTNIIKVRDAGATPNGNPYFVMEYIDGPTLTAYCDSSQLSIPQRLGLFIDVCRAVHHAHQLGAIHRDLKPQNILVALQDDKPVPKLIDFGIAKVLISGDDEPPYRTEKHRGMGTLEYMSPEQTGTLRVEIGIQADVYSLGVILYELVTGTLPLDLEPARKAGFQEQARIICDVDPPRPSTRILDLCANPTRFARFGNPEAIAASRAAEIGALAKVLSGDLDWIIARALEKEPERRYRSVDALADDVRRHLSGEPVSAAPPSATYRAKKFVRRHRIAAVAGTITALALVGATVVSAYFAHRERVQANVALEAQGKEATHRRAAEAARDRLLAIQDFLIRTMQSQDPNAQEGRTDILVSEAMQQAIALIDQGELAAQPRVVADILNAVSVVFLNLGKPSDAEQAARRALRLYEAETPEGQLARAECLGNLGFCLSYSGQLEDGFRELNRALEIRRQVQGADDLKTVKLLNGLGLALENLGRPIEALPYHESALKSCSALVIGDHSDLAACINNVAGCLSRLGRHADALPQYEAALAMCRRLHEGDHPDVATGMNNVAFCLDALGRRSDAEAIYRESLAMRERVWKGDHPDIAEVAGNLAQCLFNQGRSSEAVPYFDRSLAVFTRIYGLDHHDIATAAFRYAACLASLGRKQEAAEQLRTVVQVRRRVLPPTHPDIEVAEMSLGGVLIQLGEFGEAEPLLLGVEDRLRGRKDVPRQTQRFSLTVLVKLYERLDAEKPGVGYGTKAAFWKERLTAFDAESP